MAQMMRTNSKQAHTASARGRRADEGGVPNLVHSDEEVRGWPERQALPGGPIVERQRHAGLRPTASEAPWRPAAGTGVLDLAAGKGEHRQIHRGAADDPARKTAQRDAHRCGWVTCVVRHLQRATGGGRGASAESPSQCHYTWFQRLTGETPSVLGCWFSG